MRRIYGSSTHPNYIPDPPKNIKSNRLRISNPLKRISPSLFRRCSSSNDSRALFLEFYFVCKKLRFYGITSRIWWGEIISPLVFQFFEVVRLWRIWSAICWLCWLILLFDIVVIFVWCLNGLLGNCRFLVSKQRMSCVLFLHVFWFLSVLVFLSILVLNWFLD